MGYRFNIGRQGESFATRVLIEKGYRILERNYRGRFGEIDIIARKDNCLHFIEVKTRIGDECGLPAEAVDDTKLSRIKRTIDEYLRYCKKEYGEIAIDVFEISADLLTNVA